MSECTGPDCPICAAQGHNTKQGKDAELRRQVSAAAWREQPRTMRRALPIAEPSPHYGNGSRYAPMVLTVPAPDPTLYTPPAETVKERPRYTTFTRPKAKKTNRKAERNARRRGR